MKQDFLYATAARSMALQIRTGVLKAGDRLPSIRTLCSEQGFSINTAKRIYLELEKQALIESRPQSGYFVSNRKQRRLPEPEPSSPMPVKNSGMPNQLISKVYATMGEKDLTLFSIGVPSDKLLPLSTLNREMTRAMRQLPGNGSSYEALQGNSRLRQAIARRSFFWGGRLSQEDIITTAGGMNALSFCMMAISRPGNTIAVESPVYPGILQLARSLGLRVLELPTHPETGIEIGALKKMIHRIDLCLLITNFGNPLGSLMPDAHKKELVRLLETHQIPLIEDDLYGDLYFGKSRPQCCKAYDRSGNVLLCSSVSKTLAPGYRVGWVAPGRFKEQLLNLKYVHSVSATAITQETVARFFENNRYDHHLRQLRHQLQLNRDRYTDAIASSFPGGTKISRPQGGLALWVALDPAIDTAVLYERAIRQKISIAPGRMFTLQDQYNHCMRLCIGLPWTDELERKLKQLGKITAALL
ncbi:PLP-dependent aminotransferase family protein [Niabella beijingensis]|uniref:aminotransferase-like domain-containing protein n=1 Tax=Niabella beijingensis TaxID=2872700 RepID=UPI001CBF1C8C|nr:PLP-dependent aminotransferase family protein [Niabella beijingensis]MBZ4188504.1 PLP-dependent aminotransferase family protein [Niabella beijingensis]